MSWFFVGVDLGQKQDFTAIAIVERVELRGEWSQMYFAWRKEVALRLRYLERVPLETPYTEVVERVVEVTHSRELLGKCRLAVDATGVGAPVVDLLRRAGPGCTLLPATITSGDMETLSNGTYRIPKRDLIIGLQVALELGRIQIAGRVPYAEELRAELAAMEVKVTISGNEQYGAWRAGKHDDLVFALALAYWNVNKAYPNPVDGKEQWWTNRYEAEAAAVFHEVVSSLPGVGDGVYLPRRR